MIYVSIYVLIILILFFCFFCLLGTLRLQVPWEAKATELLWGELPHRTGVRTIGKWHIPITIATTIRMRITTTTSQRHRRRLRTIATRRVAHPPVAATLLLLLQLQLCGLQSSSLLWLTKRKRRISWPLKALSSLKDPKKEPNWYSAPSM